MPTRGQDRAPSRWTRRGAAVAALAFAQVLPAQTPVRPATIDDVLSLRSVSDVSISPDGRWVAYVVTARDREANITRSAVWLVSTEGGVPRQLSRGPRADRSPRWAPDGTWIAFLSDREAPRVSQVYGIEPSGGEAWRVTRSETNVSAFRLSPDGQRIAFISPAKAPKADEELEKQRGRPLVRDSAYAGDWNHLWIAQLADRAAVGIRQSSPAMLDVTGMEWGPDSRQIAWSAKPTPTLRSNAEGAVYVQSDVGAEPRKVTQMPGGESVAAWTDELGLLVYGTGQRLGTYNRRIWLVPLLGGEPVSLTDGLDEDANYVHSDGRVLVVEAAARTGRGLYLVPLESARASGAPRPLSDGARFYTDFSVSRAGDVTAFIAETASDAPDVHVSMVASFRPRRLTTVNPEGTVLAFGQQRVVSWKSSADGEPIEGVLTLPVGYSAGTRVPLLLVIHGGPSGVSSNRFPSMRGAYPITRTTRFAAASAGAGATDLISMYAQTDMPEFYHTYLGPRPWENFELYEQRSAYRFVKNVATPLLIQAGEADRRVPAEQSVQFYEAMKGIGRAPVALVIYPGQPHGIADPRLSRDLMHRNIEWFTRWIPVSGSVQRASPIEGTPRR